MLGLAIIDRRTVTSAAVAALVVFSSRGAAIAALVAFSATGWPYPASAQTATDDRFLAGYATAILTREFGVTDALVTVENATVRIRGAAFAGVQGDRIRLALAGLPGVRGVVFDETPPPPTTASAPALPTGAARVEQPAFAVLPPGLLFEPLTADLRWPRFSASYQYYRNDPDVEHAAAVSFGETFSLYRQQTAIGAVEVQFTAGVFSTFDLATDSYDLINTDFRVGIPVAWRSGDWSAIARLYHQSSHLGDEYLLRETRVDRRVDFSYEALDAFLSFDIGRSWRIYGGGGALLRKEPDALKRPFGQGGVEFVSPAALLGGRLRPVAAVDLQARAQDDWDPEVSVHAGVQLEGVALVGRRIQLLAQYYKGRNPNGQFYDRGIEFVGLGLTVKSE